MYFHLLKLVPSNKQMFVALCNQTICRFKTKISIPSLRQLGLMEGPETPSPIYLLFSEDHNEAWKFDKK